MSDGDGASPFDMPALDEAPADLAAPRDLTPPVPKRVFVTSRSFPSNLGGLAGADAKCQSLATAAGLTGIYQAWLSDNSYSPSTRMTHSSEPYVLVTGALVATDWSDLTSGSIRHAISVTELGMAPPPPFAQCSVWTDTSSDGTLHDPGATCGDWTDPMSDATIMGDEGGLDDWTVACSGSFCGGVAVLYCFEQ